MTILEYPFDPSFILKKKKSIKRSLLSDEQINRVMELLKTKAEIKKAHRVVKSELKKYNGQIKLIAKNKLNGDK